MLAPLVKRLRRWGFGRVLSTGLVVLIAFVMLSIIGAVLASQLADLAHKLPEYQHNVQRKVESVRDSSSGPIRRVSTAIQKFSDELSPPSASPAKSQPLEERPVSVEIHRTPFSPVELIQKILASIVGGVLTVIIVIVFVIFMLIEQEDLRDRLIRLAGSRQVNLTTNVLDDAAQRVSRYLLAQFVVNSAYGILTGALLYFIQVPNPLLWAMLAGIFRYIPYLGIWIAAIMPAAVAFAVKPGWLEVPIIFGVYFGVDLLMYNFAEPLLYGSSTGLSPLAILVAAVFWTWLWGPAGLLLATPLTVCVVVIGRHVPNLTFLQVLLSDEPVLHPKTRFYQRMLALDLDEAKQVCDEFLKTKPLDELYDEVIVPALRMAEDDRHGGKLDEEQEQFIFQNTRRLVEETAERAKNLLGNGSLANEAATSKIRIEFTGPVQVVCVPARDEADELAALMLKELLQRHGLAAKLMQAGRSPGKLLADVDREKPKIVCVLAVPPFAYMHSRYVCRRLRHQFPQLKIVSAILTGNGKRESAPIQRPSAANETARNLKQAVSKIVSLAQVRPTPAAEHAPRP
jgi:predicted PurR-regulated permease PerM